MASAANKTLHIRQKASKSKVYIISIEKPLLMCNMYSPWVPEDWGLY